MTCEGCVKSISNSLHSLEGSHHLPKTAQTHLYQADPATGINKVEANLKDQLVFIEGTAPPSSIVTAIESTGRDAILRGSGTTNSTESPAPNDYSTRHI